MVDLTKCQSEQCKIKDQCFRYTAIASKQQSYADFHDEDLPCDFLIDNEGK